MKLNKFSHVLACAAALLSLSACKDKKPVDHFVHVAVYGQMNSRYEPFLTAKFRTFSRERATLPSGRKIMVSEVMQANFYDHLADPAYREQAQMIVLNSEQEAAADPNLATEFAHARKACTAQIPCYLLVPNSVGGEQRDAAQQLLDYLAPAAAAPTPAENTSPPAANQ
jgi:hypothetical protein